jgi:hypothetical protein
MNCASCGHTNPASVKFCVECGTAVSARCPSCHSELHRAAKFCGECGAEIRVSGVKVLDVREGFETPNTVTPSPLAYTPKHLADKILRPPPPSPLRRPAGD